MEEQQKEQMDKLTDEERAYLRTLLRKGARPEGEVGIGWGSWKFYMSGINLITFMFATYVFGSLYMFWDFKNETLAAHTLLAEGQAEQAFINTLTIEQRAALGLQMPESLARKLLKQQKYDKYGR